MIVRPSPLAVVLSLAGALLIGVSVFQHPDGAPWATTLLLVSLAAWVARTILALAARRAAALRTAAAVAAGVGVLAGSLCALPTNGLGVVPAAVCTVVLLADPEVRLGVGLGVALTGLGLLAVTAIGSGAELLTLLAMLFGMLLAVLGGYSRRQRRASQRQAALLAERDLQMREEASRVALARDLHDVLAHTLGGLVIQLDAAEALLDAGEAGSARTRVTEARALAGAGLDEARRAVGALRAPAVEAGAEVDPERLRAMLDDLLDAHRALGGTVHSTVTGMPVPLPATTATALQRALQEALSNVRRHAAGEDATVLLDWRDDSVVLRVSNPLPASTASVATPSPGGGYGLAGMRERFAALPLGGSVQADGRDGVFTLTAEARTR